MDDSVDLIGGGGGVGARFTRGAMCKRESATQRLVPLRNAKRLSKTRAKAKPRQAENYMPHTK